MCLIGETALSIFDIAALVASSEPIALSSGAVARIAAARAIVETYADGDEPIYGLNTGLGGNIGFRLERDAIRAFQSQLIVGRNIGVGAALPEIVCRAALLSRIVEIATGGSGMSRSPIDLMVGMFNAGVTPVIPARGSISAADLGLSGHIGAVVIGRGQAWFGGERLPGLEALRRAGLSPATLEPKDGLALCNHSGPSAGLAAMTLADLGLTLAVAASVAGLSFEAYGANPRIFHAGLNAARPATGQGEAAALFRHLLSGSPLNETPRSVQDALSFRCLAPIFGTMLTAFAHARREVEIEINSSPDNPVVLIDDELMLSTPNFHTASMALAFDTLKISMAHLAAASAQRVIKLMNPALSRLPKYLSPVGGASAGYVPLQKAASGLHAEIRLFATPASLDAMPVSDSVEDHAPLTLLAIRQLADQLVPFKLLVAIEALVAAQGVDLATDPRLSPSAASLHALLRAAVPMLQEDREAGIDVMAIADTLERADMRAGIIDRLAPLGLPILPKSDAGEDIARKSFARLHAL